MSRARLRPALDPGVGKGVSMTRRPAALPRAQWWAVAVLVGLGAIALKNTYGLMRRPQGNDLTVYLFNAWALAHGEDPYAPTLAANTPRYPLTLAALLVPFTWMPEWIAQTIWFV